MGTFYRKHKRSIIYLKVLHASPRFVACAMKNMTQVLYEPKYLRKGHGGEFPVPMIHG